MSRHINIPKDGVVLVLTKSEAFGLLRLAELGVESLDRSGSWRDLVGEKRKVDAARRGVSELSCAFYGIGGINV